MDIKTVLIIEDDANIVELLKIHLHDLGCKVTTESDGLKRLGYCKRKPFQSYYTGHYFTRIEWTGNMQKIRQTDRHTPILNAYRQE